MKRGMTGDYSWTYSAGEYLKLYERVLEGNAERPVEEENEPNPVVID